MGPARSHLRYLERDGVQRDGSPGNSYSALEDRCDGRTFLNQCREDRHQFRLVASPEDGALYDDLKPLVRRFMGQVECDLGTSLEWIAIDHFDTEHPHSHIILRGRDEFRKDLIIAPEYLRRGMGARLAELVTCDLGPTQEFETRRWASFDLRAERLTSLDKELLDSMAPDGTVIPRDPDPLRHAGLAGRLKKLHALGFAEPLGRARWRISQELENQLERLGERGAAVEAIEHELKSRGLERAPAEWAVGKELPAAGITGCLVATGKSSGAHQRYYMIIDGADGRLHHVDLDERQSGDAFGEGSILRISAAQNVREEPNTGRGPSPLRIEMLSVTPVEQLTTLEGPTWLDRQLAGDDKCHFRDCGFGRKVRLCLALRQQWLIENELGGLRNGEFILGADAFHKLRQREMSLEGTAHAAPSPALHQKSFEFALVPWESPVEGHVREIVSGGHDCPTFSLDQGSLGLGFA